MQLAMPPRLRHWLETRADDDLLRWLFAALITATVAVAALDYVALSRLDAEGARGPSEPQSTRALPVPDSVNPGRTPVRRPEQRAGQMTFELQPGGRLTASGEIVPGSAAQFEAEIAKRGEYVKTVVLHSPGGSLDDALAMGRLIRARKLGTEVAARAYCASACPLVFAGGIERRAAPNAAIGVHRAVAVSSRPLQGQAALAEGQRISAESQRYLREMGVDLAVWIHAMETPHDELYNFTPKELIDLKLATAIAAK
jgi:hypothetical protein